jgi:hypothetical protein
MDLFFCWPFYIVGLFFDLLLWLHFPLVLLSRRHQVPSSETRGHRILARFCEQRRCVECRVAQQHLERDETNHAVVEKRRGSRNRAQSGVDGVVVGTNGERCLRGGGVVVHHEIMK